MTTCSVRSDLLKSLTPGRLEIGILPPKVKVAVSVVRDLAEAPGARIAGTRPCGRYGFLSSWAFERSGYASRSRSIFDGSDSRQAIFQ